MAQDMPEALATMRGVLGQLLPVFGKVEPTSLPLRESLAALQSIHSINFVQDIGRLPMENGSRGNLFHLLAVCLNETRILNSDHLCDAFSILADASRKPSWRLDFGKCESRSLRPGWPIDPNHQFYLCSPDQWSRYESESILQVAVRTLHTHYVGHLGRAAYHALRLISNCCADNDANKRVVLECGGIELLLRCANIGLWPDVITAALWNICAESEAQNSEENVSATNDASLTKEPDAVAAPGISAIACTQLVLRSTGECDDSDGENASAAEITDGRRHKNIIQQLLELANLVKDDTWKEMVSELLEKASWRMSWSSSVSTTEGQHNEIPEGTRLMRPSVRPEDFLADLLTNSGRMLAMARPECNCDVTRTIAILLSFKDVQRALIDEDLARAFLEVPNWGGTAMQYDGSAGSALPRAMFSIRQSLFKTIYDLSASPEFAAKYGTGIECPTLITNCIDALTDISNLEHRKKAVNTIPAASACVILANLTKSAEYALFLVQRKNVHLSLGLILRQRQDSTTLFPAIALLDRLAIPPENKTAIFGAGVTYELPRFLTGFDIQPRIQREAVSVMRKITMGNPEQVSGIGACTFIEAGATGEQRRIERAQEQSGLLAAMNLFQRTSDTETKIEIGRLLVEVCRTLCRSTGGHPEPAEDAIRAAFGSASDIADPIAYIACNGMSREVRGEGWFGLTMLSTWEYGRPFVVECLAHGATQDKLDEALRDGDRASSQNIGLMLTKLHLFPSHLVLPSTRAFLDRAVTTLNLPQVWPVHAPAP